MSILDSYFDTDPAIEDGLRPELAMIVRLAPWPFADELKVEYSVAIYRRIFELVRKSGFPIGGLKFTPSELAVPINAHRRATGQEEVGWSIVSYDNPGSEFSLQLRDGVIQFKLFRKPLKDMVRCVKEFAVGITDVLLEENLERLIQLKSRATSVTYHFGHSFVLKKHKIAKREVKNDEVMRAALSISAISDIKNDDYAPSNAIPSLGIENFLRMDYKHHAIMEFRGLKYNGFVGLEAPWNTTQKRLDVTARLNMEEEFGLRFPEAFNWEVPVVDFYRDTILQRFLPNLMANTDFESNS